MTPCEISKQARIKSSEKFLPFYKEIMDAHFPFYIILFTLRKQTCPQIPINNITVPNKDTVRYLGMTLVNKSKQLRDKLKNFYWLFGRRSNLSTQNKLTLYKTVIKPVWTYGFQLWGTASNSNIEILQRFQSKTLRSLINASWYVTKETIHCDLKIPTVKNEIYKSRSRYNTRVNNHHNSLVTTAWHDGSDPQTKKKIPFRLNP